MVQFDPTMVQCIDSTDNRYFTQTSDKPYDRNWYKVWCTDGSVKILEDYYDVQTAWWNFKQYIETIEVIDAKRSKTSGSGFGS